LRGVWQDPDPSSGAPERTVGHVELTIAEPPPGTAPLVQLEVYRTADLTAADDFRRMTPLYTMDVTEASWETITLAGAELRVVRYVDATAEDWKIYAYRAVARGAGVAGAPAGTRSGASRATMVRTESISAPLAPTTLAATTSPDPSGAELLVVTFSAEPPGSAFGRSMVQLLDADSGALLAQSSADEAAAGGGYRLHARIPASGQLGRPVNVAVRLIDPRNRGVTSAPVVVPS
jgi:hypothetical protein